MDDKMKMAHDIVCAMVAYGNEPNKIVIDIAWEYADAMQSEYDKRNYPENPDSSGWQPDWSQAQPDMKFFAVDADGNAYFYSHEPKMHNKYDYWCASAPVESIAESYKEHSYTGDWRNSLRSRP